MMMNTTEEKQSVSDFERLLSQLEETLALWDYQRTSGSQLRLSIDITSTSTSGNNKKESLSDTHQPWTLKYTHVSKEQGALFSKTTTFSPAVSSQALSLRECFIPSSADSPHAFGLSDSFPDDADSFFRSQKEDAGFLEWLPRLSASTPLHRWTGFPELITLSPVDLKSHESSFIAATASTIREGISQMSSSKSSLGKTHLLLSALRVAASNCHCSIPVFVLSGPAWKQIYQGTQVQAFDPDALEDFHKDDNEPGESFSGPLEYHVSMTHLPYIVPQYSNLPELLHLFRIRSRILHSTHSNLSTSPSSLDSPSALAHEVRMRAAYTYDLFYSLLDLKLSSSNPKRPSKPTPSSLSPQGANGMRPAFGVPDALEQLLLEACFPISTAQHYLSLDSHLSLQQSQHWRLSAHFNAPHILPGTAALTRVLQTWLSSLRMTQPSFVDKTDLRKALLYILDDSASPLTPVPMNLNSKGPRLRLDSVPYGSLLHKLALRLLDVASPEPKFIAFDCGLSSFLKGLWGDLLLLLRDCWDQGLEIPGVDMSLNESHMGLDYRTCLLHQKLCMLNLCIRDKNLRVSLKERGSSEDRKWKRIQDHPLLRSPSEQSSPSSSSPTQKGLVETLADLAVSVVGPPSPRFTIPGGGPTSFTPSNRGDVEPKSWASEHSWIDVPRTKGDDAETSLWRDIKNEVLFEQNSETLDSSQSLRHSEGLGLEMEESLLDLKPTLRVDPIEIEPTGRLKPLGTLRLLSGTDLIWIPETQEPVCMTEDMLNARQDELEKLGTTTEGSRTRAKLQCEHLLSDMQAFKAANPSCVLADFIRWHSPRDWITETDHGDDGHGRLSDRMTEPNNLWQELWEAAQPVPKSQQKPLFDYEAHVPILFGYFESLTVHQILQMLLPVFVFTFYEHILSHPSSSFPFVQQVLESFKVKWNQMDWKLVTAEEDVAVLEALIADIQSIEDFATKSLSLLKRIPDQHDLIQRLILKPQVLVDDIERPLILDVIHAKMKILGVERLSPLMREFIFLRRSSSDYSKMERMYAQLRDGDFRIVETFSRSSF